MSYSEVYLQEAARIAGRLDRNAIESLVRELAELRDRGGRLFVLGVGGSAANASHAVNDFRKITGIEAYAPTDNAAELTARINDDGWAGVFADWLAVSRVSKRDAVLVLSVGGGDEARGVSPNLVEAVKAAKKAGARVLGIVSRDGGYTAKNADACVIVPAEHPDRVTPHAEAFQSVVWHLLVSHPDLQKNPTKWESIQKQRKGEVK